MSTASRYWPFTNGSDRILDKYAKHIDLGSGERVAVTTDGFSLRVYADDLIGRHLLLSGRFDRSVAQVLLDRAKPGDTLLDIGANIGYYSALFLSNVSGGKVICIEPQPGIVDLLQQNVAQFGEAATVMPTGLADGDGTLRFAVNTSNRGASKFSPDGDIEVAVKEARKVLRSIPHIDLMKIDVEGFEEPIFRNAEIELARLKPRAILLEDQTGAVAPEGSIGSILSRLGYRILGVKKHLFRTTTVPIQSRQDCQFNDYLAVLEEVGSAQGVARTERSHFL